MDPAVANLLKLLRLVAFMVLLYLLLGVLVERYSRKPDSKVKAFFRTLCLPVTKPVARLLSPGAEYRRVLAVSLGVVAGVWVALVAVTEALRVS
jgi:hypothetical protein